MKGLFYSLLSLSLLSGNVFGVTQEEKLGNPNRCTDHPRLFNELNLDDRKFEFPVTRPTESAKDCVLLCEGVLDYIYLMKNNP